MNGEYHAVWNELRVSEQLTDGQREEAWLVATETMKRVARNANRLATRLEENGWKALTSLTICAFVFALLVFHLLNESRSEVICVNS